MVLVGQGAPEGRFVPTGDAACSLLLLGPFIRPVLDLHFDLLRTRLQLMHHAILAPQLQNVENPRGVLVRRCRQPRLQRHLEGVPPLFEVAAHPRLQSFILEQHLADGLHVRVHRERVSHEPFVHLRRMHPARRTAVQAQVSDDDRRRACDRGVAMDEDALITT